MLLLMHLLFPWLSVNCGSAASEDSKFNCHFTFDGSLHNTACKIALFHSHRSFHFDRHRIYVTESDMCSGDEYQRSLPEEVRGASAGFIVAARRGKCSFLTKNRVATNAGHPALIIINSDSEVFPFGEQSDVSAELVPAVMVEHSFQQSALSQCGFRDNCFVHNGILSFVSLDACPLAVASVERNVKREFNIILIGCIIFVGIASMHGRFGRNQLQLVAFLLIVAFSLLTKYGTFRTLHNSVGASGIRHVDAKGNVIFYDHKETDEKIFEYLVNSVYESWSRYYIPSEIISQYQLAPENYGDRLFIHPPLYVALCLACRSWLGLSLPAVSLLCHCVTCALVLALPYGLQRVFMRYNADHSLLTNVSLLAVLIYAFCPIVSFVSQKVWIDNAAVMCVTFSAVVHLMLSAYCMDTITGMRHGSGNEKIIRYITPSCFLLQFISGLVFGGIALNTKISSLALLPFILLVTLHSSLYSLIQESLTRRAIVNTVICLIAFACGMACGHGPWIWMYWQATGRVLPNAWPSATMLTNSHFVKKAVEKSMWTYVQTLLEYTPVHLAGLVAVSISIGLFSICYLIKSGSPSHIMSGTIMLAVISVWPLAYIASLTVLGAAGAGFQSRFLLPALPATAVLTSIVALPEDFMNALPNEKKDKSFKRFMNAKNNNAVVIIVVLLVLVGAFHTIYYCVLYPNLFADFEVSIADVIGQMLSSPLRPLESKTALSEMANFMIHHGLNISR